MFAIMFVTTDYDLCALCAVIFEAPDTYPEITRLVLMFVGSSGIFWIAKNWLLAGFC